MDVHKKSPIRLNLGAGKMALDGWLSVGLEDQHDIKADLHSLPLPDDYADEAMAIHVFEHFHRWEALDVLQEWRRVMKIGATLVLELPELMRCCRNVLEYRSERYGHWGIFGDPGYKDPLMVHKWCYTERELCELLTEAGFKRVRIGKPEWHGRKSLRDMRVECVK
jgi:predicted SAM-dependent methyltransferase